MFVGGDGGGDGLDPCVHFLLDSGRDTGKTRFRGVSMRCLGLREQHL